MWLCNNLSNAEIAVPRYYPVGYVVVGIKMEVEYYLQFVTARKNRPFSYKFTLANQRNSWTFLNWTSQIPLKVAFPLENNLEE